MHRIAVAAVLAAGPLASVAFASEEVSRVGEAVVVSRLEPEGDRYEITITPPADRGVDRRVVEWLRESEAEAATAADDGSVMDLSGYSISVERVVAASCGGKFSIKSKSSSLSARTYVKVTSTTAFSVGVGAFPTSGDVDALVFIGSLNNNPCSQSIKTGQTLDWASCTNRACTNGGGSSNQVIAVIANLTSSSASYVGVWSFVFTQ